MSKDRLGYPTQKPTALLKRIIRASCPEGGVVLDPFCECGTTIYAVYDLNINDKKAKKESKRAASNGSGWTL